MTGFALTPLASAGLVAVAIAAVAALYLLRPPARRLVVPSSLIWDRILNQTRRTSDRLRWWLSLLLASMIAACLVLALTRPWIAGGAPGAGQVVIVIDNSATMATRTTDGMTRFERARSRARSLIQAAGPDAQIMLADTMRQIATPAFESAESANTILNRLRPGHERDARIPETVAVIPAQDRYLITDGVLLAEFPADMTPVSVFDPVENCGITAFQLRPVPGDAQRYEAFIEVTNAGGTAKDLELTLTGIGAPRLARKLTVQANSTTRHLFDVSKFGGGPVRAAVIALGDGFADDDVAYDFLPMRRSMRVTLVTASDAYLGKSLLAQPRIRLNVVRPNLYRDTGDADIFIFDRFTPRERPSAPILLVRPAQASWLPELGRSIADPQIARWDGSHPLLENISLRNLHIDHAMPARLDAVSGMQVLVSARGDEPLVLAQDGARRWVWLAFDLVNSNFALNASFPVFLNNAIDWMAGEPAVLRAHPGIIRLPGASARVIAMDGSELPVIPAGGAIQFDARAPGLYTAVTPQSRIPIAVSVLDPAVTGVNHSRLSDRNVTPEAASNPTARPPLEPWTALLLLALLLLIVEWLGYNRRVTV